MLAELHIHNFAIIDQLHLVLNSGLITFTGETGAGKSIIIDAVELLMGGRAEISMIRTGSDQALIEATFKIPEVNREAIQSLLNNEELLDNPDYFTVGREIRTGGRSVARLNGRTVSAGLLRDIGELLVDVHGQSEHLSLLRVREHLNLLDRYAGNDQLLDNYSQVFRQLTGVRRELNELQMAESEAARRIDMLNYQINEIEAARLEPDEEDQLRAERARLANAENLSSITQKALITLDDGTPDSPSVTDLMGQILDAITNLSRIDPSQNQVHESLQTTFSTLTDISRDLRSYLDGIEFNPDRLNQVEDRLDLISNLKRKYGETIPLVLDFLVKARVEKETITHASEMIAALETQEKSLLIELGKHGKDLSVGRHQAAKKLEQEIESELDELNLEEAQFKVEFSKREHPEGIPNPDGRLLAYDSTGYDQVEFLIAPNPGEGLKPLVKIASGGETSRLMLALKNVLARADRTPTLIFDEIDQGIGGRVGTIVGHKLWILSRHHQVLCVTHLPQLAAFGDQHLQVSKKIEDGRTITEVTALNDGDRIDELALMLGESSDRTRRTAQDMLITASNLTDR